MESFSPGSPRQVAPGLVCPSPAWRRPRRLSQRSPLREGHVDLGAAGWAPTTPAAAWPGSPPPGRGLHLVWSRVTGRYGACRQQLEERVAALCEPTSRPWGPHTGGRMVFGILRHRSGPQVRQWGGLMGAIVGSALVKRMQQQSAAGDDPAVAAAEDLRRAPLCLGRLKPTSHLPRMPRVSAPCSASTRSAASQACEDAHISQGDLDRAEFNGCQRTAKACSSGLRRGTTMPSTSRRQTQR